MAGKRSNTTKARASSEEIPASSKKLKKTLEGEAVDKKEEESEIQQSSIGVSDDELEARFLGDVVPAEEARHRWPKRYEESIQGAKAKTSKDKAESDEIIQARCHYMRAEVDGRTIYDLYDDAHVKAGEGEDSYICKIVEMFEGVDGALYFTAQWYYRARDTVIKDKAISIDRKRVFFSEVQDDNPLDCLLAKLNIVRLPLNVDLDAKKKSIPNCDYYCDTKYLLPYSTFENLPAENNQAGSETTSTISVDVDINGACEVSSEIEEACQGREHNKEVRLLDLYSGCGAMSTGLCLGAQLSGLNLVTRWAVDLNQHACDSLKVNHPETKVRNESADDFLSLLKEWEKLCVYFNLVQSKSIKQHELEYFNGEEEEEEEEEEEGDDNDEEAGEDSENFEVEKILDVCYGDPKDTDKRGLYFKVRWRGYGADEDTWEPMDGLSHCKESIKQFVIDGFQSKILPLSGDVHVICGGPPCQGISGFNRFRNKENPLKDEKNKQLIVFMDIVQYLKPKFVLMENVVDLVKFADGFLGRYALGRLIEMNYQARMGMMAAGAYGLPQFRMRVFLWGACPTEKLPQYPLPTHDVVVRGVIPLEFESNTVAYNEGHHEELEKRLLLEDAISDLPAVGNYDNRDEMPYEKPPQTEFQKFIRLSKNEMLGYSKPSGEPMLYDHRSLELNPDDYARVCRVPKNKGANFRDFPGVRVRSDNKVEWDPNVKRVYLDSGKPLVPDYAMSFVNGSSSKPFGRLWWDETVPTVVTRAEPHNQVILHPEQDRVLSVRENARLQGFPDYYKLSGPVKERYIQVGNAVAVPVARAIGYALGIAYQGSINEGPLFKLPSKFLNLKEKLPSASSEDA